MDERELVRRAKQKDVTAFEILVDRHWAKIYRLVEALIGSNDAEAVTVDVFVRAWESLPRFREAASFGTWVHRIAVNLCHEYLRRRRWEIVTDEIPTGERLSLGDIEDIVCDREMRRLIRQWISELPEHLRVPLILRFWQELSYREIAQVLGTKESTVRMRVATAIERLSARWRAIYERIPEKGDEGHDL